MIEQLLGVAALVALGLWIMRRRFATPGRRDADIDHDELEAAERDVRDLGSSVREDGFVGDDWGPGAGGRPRGSGT